MRANSKLAGRQSRSPRGFTLLEILVAIALFVVLSIVIVNVYLLALRAQRQTSIRQEVLTSARYIMETMARQVRISSVDYSYAYDGDGTAGLNGPENELALITPEDDSIVYSLVAGELRLEINGLNYALTNTEKIEVINLDFYIEPAFDPFIDERCSVASECLPAALGCTSSGGDPSGFCNCNNDIQCQTGHCDPDEGICLPFDIQPRVTIILDFQAKQLRPEEQKTIFLQTTVSSRIYQR